MRICFCIDTMESGGAERVASILCNEFVKMGNSTDLVLISEKEKRSFYKIEDGVNLIPLLKNVNKKATFVTKIKELKKLFKNSEYDVVISFLPNVNTCVNFALGQKRRFLHVVSERNNPLADPKNRIRRFLKEMAFKKSDGIVCQTNIAHDYYQKKVKCPIKVIKNPVNVPDIIVKNDTTNSTIISVGRLESQKNMDLLIRAFAVFNKNHPESKLVIYGSGSLFNALKELIVSYKLEQSAYLCGNSNNWVLDNRNCALFINTSLYEGMPNSLLEALTNGMPCIVSDCPSGGSKELLSNNNGLLFQNNNLDDLLCKMELLYKNNELIKMFRNNNEIIKAEYKAERIASSWISFINSLREGKKDV